MKSFLFPLFFLPFLAFSQPKVAICLEKTATELEIKLIPSTSFQGVVSNIQFTIKWDDASVTLATPSQDAAESAYIPMSKQSTETTVGSEKYQKFAGFGTVNMSTASATWATGFTPIVLMRISPSSLSPNFEIVNDAWTATENGDFYAELNGKKMTDAIVVCGTNPFPLTMGPLKGQWLEKGAFLTWETYSEVNTAHFEVQRSLSGFDFTDVGQVAAAGNSTSTIDYHFTDESSLLIGQSKVWYKIKAVSDDGSVQFTNTIALTLMPAKSINCYPNPASTYLTIAAQNTKADYAKINIWNMNGQNMLATQKNIQNNTLKTDLYVGDLATGLYLLEIILDGEQNTFKFVKE